MTDLRTCDRCGGSGYDPEYEREIDQVCSYCGGQGQEVVTLEMAIDAGDREMAGMVNYCGQCGGQGGYRDRVPDACSRCGGRGEVPLV